MQTVNDLFEQKLRKRITDRIEELKEELAAFPVSDVTQHNNTIGRIAGLREVFGLCDDIQSELKQR